MVIVAIFYVKLSSMCIFVLFTWLQIGRRARAERLVTGQACLAAAPGPVHPGAARRRAAAPSVSLSHT